MLTPENRAQLDAAKLPQFVDAFVANVLDFLGDERLPLFAWAACKGERRSVVVFTIFDGSSKFVAVYIPHEGVAPLCDVHTSRTMSTHRFSHCTTAHLVAEELRELVGPTKHY
jgi:hypothetical protein